MDELPGLPAPPLPLLRFVALNIPGPFPRATSHPQGPFALWYQVVLATPWLGRARLRARDGFVPLSSRAVMRTRPPSEEDIGVYAARLREPDRAHATMPLYRTFIFGELWSVLGGRYRGQRLTVPTLVLFGQDGAALSPKLLRGIEDHADRIAVELVDDSAHLVAEEQPDLVTRRLIEFFSHVEGQVRAP